MPTDAENLEAKANKWARVSAVTVLLIGAALIVIPAAINIGEVWDNPFEPASSVTTVVTESPGGQKVTKTTTAEADRSFVERSLAAGGLLLVRIGIVALAAFLAGAIVQRTILSDFAMKLGPLEVPQLARAAEASNKALEEIKGELGRQAEATRTAMTAAAGAAEEIASIKDSFAALLDFQEPDQEGVKAAGDETTDKTDDELRFEAEEKNGGVQP